MMFWRLASLAQIPVLIWVCHDCLASTAHAWMIFCVALLGAALYWWLAMYTKAGNSLYFHYADVAFCAILMLMTQDGELLALIYFYSIASMASRPTSLLREAVPPVLVISMAFLVSETLFRDTYYSTALLLGDFVNYYVIGVALFGFSKLLDSTTKLELDVRLEEDREEYRSRLHDDLGNNLCGLHFMIQSLTKKGVDDYRKKATFLSQGYERAGQSFARLIQGIDTKPDRNLSDLMTEIVATARADYGVTVRASGLEIASGLSPTTLKEISYIVHEAIANAARHGHAREVDIDMARRRGALTISIQDRGIGFDANRLTAKPITDSYGIDDMRKRAQSLGGRLDIKSDKQAGTVVMLSLRETAREKLSRRLVSLFPDFSQGTYVLAVYIKLLLAIEILAEVALMGPGLRGQHLVWIIAGVIMLDGTLTLLFLKPLKSFLGRSSWPLYCEQILFLVMIFFAWRSGLPLFFDAAPTAALLLSAIFLGIYRNLSLASFVGLGMLTVNLLAPATPGMQTIRVQDLVDEIMSNLIFALSASLAVLFLKHLEGLKKRQVTRSLARQRERLNSRTFNELNQLIQGLGREIQELSTQTLPEKEFHAALAGMESLSSDLKIRLRHLLRSLDDEPVAAKPAAEI